VTDRVLLAIFCVTASAGLANWIDVFHGAFEDPYGIGLAKWELLAIVGCALFGIGALASLFSGRYGTIVALTASCVSWTYFAPSLVRLPRVDFCGHINTAPCPLRCSCLHRPLVIR